MTVHFYVCQGVNSNCHNGIGAASKLVLQAPQTRILKIILIKEKDFSLLSPYQASNDKPYYMYGLPSLDDTSTQKAAWKFRKAEWGSCTREYRAHFKHSSARLKVMALMMLCYLTVVGLSGVALSGVLLLVSLGNKCCFRSFFRGCQQKPVWNSSVLVALMFHIVSANVHPHI